MAQFIPAESHLPIQDITPANGKMFSPEELQQYIGTDEVSPMFPDEGTMLLFNAADEGTVNERMCQMLTIPTGSQLKQLMIANGKSIDQDWVPKGDDAPAWQIYGNAILMREDEIYNVPTK
ncbi:MAG TPA: hypothetical protein VKR06_46680 [Ktedonosporobacter sp.]|nr:hypothetical protein [Ktedonosporobacter sp.]